jgi:hypothetical protein
MTMPDPSLADPHPKNLRAALELILPGSWEAIHGSVNIGLSFDAERLCSYEFRSNEVVSSMQAVCLESKSTSQGLRDFIGIGTSISRGEDHAVRGCVSYESHFWTGSLSA